MWDSFVRAWILSSFGERVQSGGLSERQHSRHDDAVEDLSELREGVTERVVVGSPRIEPASERCGRWTLDKLQRTRRGFH